MKIDQIMNDAVVILQQQIAIRELNVTWRYSGNAVSITASVGRMHYTRFWIVDFIRQYAGDPVKMLVNDFRREYAPMLVN